MDVMGPLLSLKLARNRDVLVRSESAKFDTDLNADIGSVSSSKKRNKGKKTQHSWQQWCIHMLCIIDQLIDWLLAAVCVLLVVDADLQGLVLSGCFHILPSGETPEDFQTKAAIAAQAAAGLQSASGSPHPSVQLFSSPSSKYSYSISNNKVVPLDCPGNLTVGSVPTTTSDGPITILQQVKRIFKRKAAVYKANLVDPASKSASSEYLPIGSLVGLETLFLPKYPGIASVVVGSSLYIVIHICFKLCVFYPLRSCYFIFMLCIS